MFKKLIIKGKSIDLYYHKTDGGAEYLMDNYVVYPNGHKEGVPLNSNVLLRIDGDELEVYRIDI